MEKWNIYSGTLLRMNKCKKDNQNTAKPFG